MVALYRMPPFLSIFFSISLIAGHCGSRNLTAGVVSLGCGAGVQVIAERYDKPVYVGLDTAFIGILEERATWTEKCIACGNVFSTGS